MSAYYKQILKDFKTAENLAEAITANNSKMYYYLSQILILNSPAYRAVETKEGKNPANRVLTNSLILFRRQVKHQKIGFDVHGERIFITNKSKTELSEYLFNLFLLIIDTGTANPAYPQATELEKKLIDGKGFQKLYELKDSVSNTLYNFGCKIPQDKEDIFNESLLVFWKKLKAGEIGIYFAGNTNKLDNCRVYNREFYQNSKISTFLISIAKYLFLNKTRTSDYEMFKNTIPEVIETGEFIQTDNQKDNPVLLMFLYYRSLVEERKVRTVVSLLQYDCNLEDKEIRQLIGINNARFHSSRLRNHFYEWYDQNLNRIPQLFDLANYYFVQRDKKKEKLNKKIFNIDLFIRNSVNHIDLELYQEEFHSVPEFTQFHRIFKNVFYLTTVGKSSGLAGLPDEELMRGLMKTYKDNLFKLPGYRIIPFLIFYGSDEPDETIITLIKSLYSELRSEAHDPESLKELTETAKDHVPENIPGLTDGIYKTNQSLFELFSNEEAFVNMINEYENPQRAI
jgi:hypothetical protein